MFFLLGVLGSLTMVGLEFYNTTNIGYWWSLTPFVVGIIVQFIAMAGAEAGSGCIGAGFEGLGAFFD